MPMRPPTHRPHGMATKKDRQYRSTEQREKDRFYHTARWRRLAKMVRNRDKYLCQICGRPGNQVDHIIDREERPDLAFDMDNLQTLDIGCHNAKRAKVGA